GADHALARLWAVVADDPPAELFFLIGGEQRTLVDLLEVELQTRLDGDRCHRRKKADAGARSAVSPAGLSLVSPSFPLTLDPITQPGFRYSRRARRRATCSISAQFSLDFFEPFSSQMMQKMIPPRVCPPLRDAWHCDGSHGTRQGKFGR